MNLTDQEWALFRLAQRGNIDPLVEHLFGTRFSGTYFTPEDRPREYGMLHESWVSQGRPDDKFTAIINEQPVELVVVWDAYYGGEPMLLLRHGFRVLDWIKPIVSPSTTKGIAITGTGSGKTGNVAVSALAYCVIYPGFGFLNAGPRQRQSDLMLHEVEKWVSNAPFVRFVEVNRGANKLWKEVDGYPTVSIISPLDPTVKSTFICQTVGTNADNILGMGRDWINVDETQLIQNMSTSEPKIITRMRGTRADGKPTWCKLTCISNPGDNLDFLALVEKYQRLQEKYPERVVVLTDVPAEENVYITRRQLEEMRMAMGEQDQMRWLDGSMSGIVDVATISAESLENCRDMELEEEVSRISEHREDLGLMSYELPYDPERDYIVVGDVGKSVLVNLGSLNIPAIMVFDITDFLEVPHKLVAFWWNDGQNTYKTWAAKMEYFILKYRCKGYYDAGNIQTAMEDVGPFEGLPMTEPVYFSGSANIKKWCLAVVTLLIQRGLFRWPYIKSLWHQARIYDPTSRKKPDDVVTCLLVFARAMAVEGTLWTRFVEIFRAETLRLQGGYSDEFDEEEELPYEAEVYARPVDRSRYARVSA